MDGSLTRVVVRGDGEYPPLLKEIPDPPMRLFVKGKSLGSAPFVAVVGTRRPSRYGIQVARSISAELARAGVTVVSGMAYGIDAAAHEGSLAAGGDTVAVLGCGIDRCYPRRHAALAVRIAEMGAVISEYPGDTEPYQWNFPRRNRIIAGISLAVVVVEGRSGGGAMITARLGGEYGRQVFAVPGPVHSAASEGPHSLLRDGATLATCGRDVLEDLGMQTVDAVQPKLQLRTDEEVVLHSLDAHPKLLDLVALDARLPVSSTAAILSNLEIRGLVHRHPGATYALAPHTPLLNRY